MALQQILTVPVTAPVAGGLACRPAAALPSARQHGWKFIASESDNKRYVPISAPHNICAPDTIDKR
ncbi:hypothetical protein IHE30_03575 [Mycetohabitans sp. B46]